MNKFTFNDRKEVIVPDSNNYVPFKDKDGKELKGDDLVKRMASIAENFESTNKRPVPIAEQNFIAWLKQAKKMLDEGKTSEDIFAQTLVPLV